MTSSPKRHFLGWSGALLAKAADVLVQEFGGDMGHVVVALPGARSGRRLRELLARRTQPDWIPPRILTQGILTDELVRLDGVPAGRLARTLAWERALRDLPEKRLSFVAPDPPGDEDFSGWLRLGETVRALHGELAPEGISFERLSQGEDRPPSRGEALRWEVLADAQERYRKRLKKLGLVDPHEARLEAIEAGKVDRETKVVLIGVADMNHLLRRLVQEIGSQVTALVFAPDDFGDGFDENGCLVTSFWIDRDCELSLSDWRVVEKPVDQADETSRVIATWNGRYAAEEITIGLADEEVAPYLARNLTGIGVTPRDAAGTPLARTRPFLLLEATARYLATRSFRHLTSLVRHPDLERSLRDTAKSERCDPAAWLDDYYGVHLPDRKHDAWPGSDERSGRVNALDQLLDGQLGELSGDGQRAISYWAATVRGFLRAVYGTLELDPDQEDDRVLSTSLALLADSLTELEDLPDALSSLEVTSAEALDLALRLARSQTIAPPAPREDEQTIELLGWLELPLDDAPALVVTGFNEGRVPQSIHGDPFLPNGLRRKLGLVDNNDRLARDLYAVTVLRHSRQQISFVTGRRNVDGDPLVPSRLAFHCPEAETVERVRHFLPSQDARPRSQAIVEDEGEAYELPRTPAPRRVDTFSVTSFKTYLSSPYLFYLRYVVGAKTTEDRDRELSPLSFGNLAHDVLDDFGKSDVATSYSADAIAAFLADRLQWRARDLYGEKPMPAVSLQLAQLEFRLSCFARHQAERASKGWRIMHSEWSPPDETVPLPGTNARLRGRVDRIDYNERLDRWAILDYKTGENIKDPKKEHLKDDRWSDLQLPLYSILTQPLGIESMPELGYVALCRDISAIGFRIADFDEAEIDDALYNAREIVKNVQAGHFFELGKRKPYEPILAGLCGYGIIAGEEPGDGVGGDE